ncbi:MAG: hypothetical protein LC781_04785 [Actinobacteria bacterium]|nr:hypothetical protein [Actinomycetota bacterium]
MTHRSRNELKHYDLDGVSEDSRVEYGEVVGESIGHDIILALGLTDKQRTPIE